MRGELLRGYKHHRFVPARANFSEVFHLRHLFRSADKVRKDEKARTKQANKFASL